MNHWIIPTEQNRKVGIIQLEFRWINLFYGDRKINIKILSWYFPTEFLSAVNLVNSCRFYLWFSVSKVRLTSTCNIAFHQKNPAVNDDGCVLGNKQHFTFDRSQEMREEIFLCTRVSQNKSRHQSRKHSLGNKPWRNCCQLVGKRTETNTPFVK